MSASAPAADRRRGRLSIALLALAAAAVLAAFVSPLFALQALRSAAEAGDADGLSEVVDYAAVRRSLAPQLREPRPTSSPEDRPAWLPPLLDFRGAARELAGPAAAQRRAEALTTPDALAGLVEGRTHIRDWGWRRFRADVRLANAPRAPPTTLTLERRGWFAWKLVQVRLPSAASAPTAGEAPG